MIINTAKKWNRLQNFSGGTPQVNDEPGFMCLFVELAVSDKPSSG